LEVLIGIDLGTTGVRAEAYNLKGEVLMSKKSSIAKQTVEQWLNALIEAVPSGIIENYAPSEKIVTADSTSGTVLLVDKYGAPLFPPLMYYESAVKENEELKNRNSAEELARKGVSISSTSPLPKIMHAMRGDPDKFRKVRWILPPTSWLLYKLHFKEGEKWEDTAVDWTNALKLGEDITSATPSWFTPIFEDSGVSAELLPSITECGSFIGEARSDLAERMGLKGAKLFHGMTDGNASAIATGCIEPGDFGLGCGTTTVPKYVCEELKPHPAIYYHKHPLRGYLAGAAPVTGGMLDWFSEKVFGTSIEEAFSYTEQTEPGKEYLYFPQGDRSPFDDPLSGAALIGLWPEDKSREEILGKVFRSIMVGITFLEYYYISLFENLFNAQIPEVKLTGGGTRSYLWNRIRASIYERPVRIMKEQVVVGALIPVALKLKLYKDAEEAANILLKTTSEIRPDTELTLKYKSSRDLFMQRWKNIREIYHI
jgi:sugar (pentulose or hexulose) kinase